MPSRETTVASIASGKTTFDEEPGAATAALHRDIEAQNAITPSPINLSIVPQWFRTALDTASSALSQTDGTGQRSSLAIIASADLVQTKGLGLALFSAR
jgi:hypothetical protein